MTRFLFDTTVFLYARGREHQYRESCRTLVRLSEDGALAGEASVELVQEFAHVLRRRGLDGPTVREQAVIVSPDRAFDPITGLERLDPRDAVSKLVSTAPIPREPS
ncbi:MAG: hypothetical protein ACRDRK_14115 [Pseudonocardia sp.]